MFEQWKMLWDMRSVFWGNFRALWLVLFHGLMFYLKYPYYCVISDDSKSIEDYPGLVKHRDRILQVMLEAQLEAQYDVIQDTVSTLTGMRGKR